MKKLRTFAVSMIIAAIGLLIYCAGFYIKSYEQNLAARQEYAELSQMAGVKNREGAGLLADGKKTDEDSSTKNSEKKRRKKQRRLCKRTADGGNKGIKRERSFCYNEISGSVPEIGGMLVERLQ